VGNCALAVCELIVCVSCGVVVGVIIVCVVCLLFVACFGVFVYIYCYWFVAFGFGVFVLLFSLLVYWLVCVYYCVLVV